MDLFGRKFYLAYFQRQTAAVCLEGSETLRWLQMFGPPPPNFCSQHRCLVQAPKNGWPWLEKEIPNFLQSINLDVMVFQDPCYLGCSRTSLS